MFVPFFIDGENSTTTTGNSTMDSSGQDIAIVFGIIFMVPLGALILFLLIYLVNCIIVAKTYKSSYGVYTPVFKKNSRYNFAADGSKQPYVVYKEKRYLLFGSNNFHSNSPRVEKLGILTVEQLNEMFPLKAYKEWLDGGKEEVESINKDKVGYFKNFLLDDELQESMTTSTSTSVSISSSTSTSEATPEAASASASTLNPALVADKGAIEKDGCNKELPGVIEEKDIADILLLKNSKCTIHESPITSTNHEKHFSSGICTICMDNLVDNDKVRGLVCGHVFHDGCITPWLTRRNSFCPVCKEDLYIKLQANEITNCASNNGNVPAQTRHIYFKMNDIIYLPTDVPGSCQLDQIFSISTMNCFSYFMILIITELEAQTLLTALLYLRNNNYSLDNTPENGNQTTDEDTIHLQILPIVNQDSMLYVDQVHSKFKQKINTVLQDVPPMPEINSINPYIQSIVEHHPRPFNPSDISCLDYDAWKKTKRMKHGLFGFRFRWLGITDLQLYYYNVIQIYNKRRAERLKPSK